MKGWTTYTTADEFATDPIFRDWVASGHFGQPDHAYTQFLIDHAHLHALAYQAADLLRITAIPVEYLSPQELTEQVDATWKKVRHAEEERDVPIIPLKRNQSWLWRAAAVLLLVGGIGWWVNRPVAPTSLTAISTWQVVTNRQTTKKALSLADGSVVWLSPGSTLRYPTTFTANRREVTLTGEAFFEVHKNVKHPFYVKTSQLTTRVVGTSFLVKVLPQNKGTLVQVRTGKVLVYRNSTNTSAERPVSLRANEELRVVPSQQPLITQPIKQPSALSERLNEQRFEFTDVPVADVFNALAKAYDMPVEYDPGVFRNCQITTDLADEPLTEKLTILAETIGHGTRAELIDNHIRITGTGCPQSNL
ncbi:FecR family protein [soil metagenome]